MKTNGICFDLCVFDLCVRIYFTYTSENTRCEIIDGMVSELENIYGLRYDEASRVASECYDYCDELEKIYNASKPESTNDEIQAAQMCALYEELGSGVIVDDDVSTMLTRWWMGKWREIRNKKQV